MVRKVMRKNEVLAATGFSKSTLYDRIKAGKFPKPTKLDPNGRISIWFEDQIADYQNAAVAAQQEGVA